MKRILSIVGAVVLMGSIAGGIYFMESHYALAEDLRKNYKQDMINQLQNNIRWYQDQMSWIMSRCGKTDPKALPEHAFSSYENYRKQKEALDARLKAELSK